MVEYYKEQVGFDVDDTSEDVEAEVSYREDSAEPGRSLESARDHLRRLLSHWPMGGPDSKYGIFLEALKKVRVEQRRQM